jgi:predicted metal-binding transcription factor (methanogenesis marker protein 9)
MNAAGRDFDFLRLIPYCKGDEPCPHRDQHEEKQDDP